MSLGTFCYSKVMPVFQTSSIGCEDDSRADSASLLCGGCSSLIDHLARLDDHKAFIS